MLPAAILSSTYKHAYRQTVCRPCAHYPVSGPPVAWRTSACTAPPSRQWTVVRAGRGRRWRGSVCETAHEARSALRWTQPPPLWPPRLTLLRTAVYRPPPRPDCTVDSSPRGQQHCCPQSRRRWKRSCRLQSGFARGAGGLGVADSVTVVVPRATGRSGSGRRVGSPHVADRVLQRKPFFVQKHTTTQHNPRLLMWPQNAGTLARDL